MTVGVGGTEVGVASSPAQAAPATRSAVLRSNTRPSIGNKTGLLMGNIHSFFIDFSLLW
jgi:hypothetical protein